MGPHAPAGHSSYPAGTRGANRIGILLHSICDPQNLGVWRAILDLKRLNHHLLYRCFKMHSLQTILGGVREGDFLMSIDLTEAYLHIPILPFHRQYLRFHYAGCHYQP